MIDKIIQVAGIQSEKELKMIIDCGIKYIGFPLFLDYHEEDLSLTKTKEITSNYLNKFIPILITYQSDALDIVAALNYLKFHTVQLHGEISEEQIKILKETESITIIKSLIVYDNVEELKNQIDVFSKYVDYFITDTFDPETGASGATGKTHNWDISKKIVNYSEKPVILAGGLTPSNVSTAIKLVQPAGVDSHTGLEKENGLKDRQKILKFIEKSNEAFNN